MVSLHPCRQAAYLSSLLQGGEEEVDIVLADANVLEQGVLQGFEQLVLVLGVHGSDDDLDCLGLKVTVLDSFLNGVHGQRTLQKCSTVKRCKKYSSVQLLTRCMNLEVATSAVIVMKLIVPTRNTLFGWQS